MASKNHEMTSGGGAYAEDDVSRKRLRKENGVSNQYYNFEISPLKPQSQLHFASMMAKSTVIENRHK